MDPTSTTTPSPAVGLVAIGRNEGERMVRCLAAALREIEPRRVVYVDSGSTDGSADRARQMGATVVDLDLSVPFTAARARNAGLAALREADPAVELVQFVDADCELVPGWLATGIEALRAEADLAGVAGRRRERFPEATLYNKLCDLEWDTPVGEARAVGGDAMFRREALDQVGGYDPTMIAGEEPEMCLRLRARGWRLRRLDAEMTLHDAAMTSWNQWWNRNKRAGHAYAETLDRHPPTGAKEVRSNYVLGLFPVIYLALVIISFAGVALLLLPQAFSHPAIELVARIGTVALIVLLLGIIPIGLFAARLRSRIIAHRTQRGHDPADAATYADWVIRGKLPQALGQLKYRWNKLRGRRSALIEYKGATPAPAPASAVTAR